MSSNKPRIGFLLASIHTGSARNLFVPLVREASRSNTAFFIFPGGRLNVVKDSEYLRNTIYSLANSNNLDGVVSWGSAIGSAVPVEELNRFHDSFSDIPYVTIAHKMPGHECVTFDAYSGMASLVRHFINVHKTKRIAYLRGPAYHTSAVERFHAFCDVMKENGCDMSDSPLVSDTFGWSEGEAAINQLYHERSLVPGRDFDVLLGSSDMMVFSAVRYLQKLGFSVPEDYCCAGFNDSVESRITSSAFSTVHMPYKELGLTSLAMIRRVLADKSKPSLIGQSAKTDSNDNNDIILPTEIVIRESCGCKQNEFSDITAESLPSGAAELTAALSKLLRLDETDSNAVVEPLVSVLESQDTQLFFSLLEKVLDRFFEQNMDIRLLYQSMVVIKNSTFLDKSYTQSLENRFLYLVTSVQNRVQESMRYKERRLNESLNSLKCGLLAARSRQNLIDILSETLPKIDINSVALVLTENDTVSRFAGGFTPETRYMEEFTFPAELLLPENITGFTSGVYLVQSLFMEKQPIGYIVMSSPPHDGAVFEELRSAISSALTGVFLFEQSALAKQKAEQAEIAKTSFFANVGTDLRDPLADITRKIEQIENLLTADITDRDLIAAQMVFLKNRVAEQYEKTNLVLELTLSQTNELPLEKRLFHIEEVLHRLSPNANDGAKNLSDIEISTEGAKNLSNVEISTDGAKNLSNAEISTDYVLPLVYGDPARLFQALNILCDEWYIDTTKLNAVKANDGIHFTLEASHPISESVWLHSNMMLAEKILLLLGVHIRRTTNGCIIVYPWPLFSCRLSEPNSSIFEWSDDEADSSEWTKIYNSRNNTDFASQSFLFTSQISESELETLKTFQAVFEQHMMSAVKSPILCIGSTVSFPQWIPDGQTVTITSIEDFESVISDMTPPLVIIDSVDCEAVEKIRKNPSTVMTPIFVLTEHITDEQEVLRLMLIPRVILCNSSIASCEEFAARARAILTGDDILPPDTGALVKKAVCYLNINAGENISRWKLADSVHVSEDYLTRIFHKEMGLSPWDYLNRYRIFLASQMLLHTNATIYTVAEKCGFQDQAYFCRVFKKINGVPPGKYRTL